MQATVVLDELLQRFYGSRKQKGREATDLHQSRRNSFYLDLHTLYLRAMCSASWVRTLFDNVGLMCAFSGMAIY